MSQTYSTSLTTLAVLERAGREGRAFRAADIRESLGLTRGQLFAHLVTLREAGWLEHLPDSTFRLSLKAHHLGQRALAQAGIGERVRPVMEELTMAVMEAVSLAVIEGETARIVQRVEPDRAVVADSTYESRMDLRHSASGRVLLAWGNATSVEALRASGVDVPGDDELAAIRSLGHALSDTDLGLETVAVAVPVFDARGVATAALSIIGPVSRFDPHRALDDLRAAAARINELQTGGDAR
ncbi:IclR family transcriptional regulator [Jiangella sp. DSM 45060]|uniref:IclR family transcriptional regulator n=1 Tax=Jiangella sp. DSM 45060 TaxID=1798224 RepID=UPI00087C1BED|nr:IclR family transcriptional regulator C-terminal domain-containing protein [Jiangella sp. DSM 45060]SDS44821.1 DNA-binding transcriptional regulator, IclR family [Jiangella sp. DSM 45060]